MPLSSELSVQVHTVEPYSLLNSCRTRFVNTGEWTIEPYSLLHSCGMASLYFTVIISRTFLLRAGLGLRIFPTKGGGGLGEGEKKMRKR